MTIQPDWESACRYVFKRLEEELPPNLSYHGIHHTRDDVLPAAGRLAVLAGLPEEDSLMLRTAALYHDIGFVERYQHNEIVAARIAAESLPQFGYNPSQIEAIRGIILATQMPQSPRTFAQQLICDADLDSLGREDFFTVSMNLLNEMRIISGFDVSLEEWYKIQVAFLSNHTYFTQTARNLREPGKQRNIQELHRRLAEIHSAEPGSFLRETS